MVRFQQKFELIPLNAGEFEQVNVRHYEIQEFHDVAGSDLFCEKTTH